MLGHEGLLRTGKSVLCWAVEVALGDRTIGQGDGRVQRVSVAVLLDEALRDNPKDLSPDLTNGVYTPVARLVKRLVR